MKILITIGLLIALSGCASITRGTKDVLVIESDPPGATARLGLQSGDVVCTTPCTLELPRKNGFAVTFELEGYESTSATVVPKQAAGGSAGMAGNVLVGGLIGAAVDATSGAMKDLTPNPLKVTLRKKDDE
jgi:hypothetical protein